MRQRNALQLHDHYVFVCSKLIHSTVLLCDFRAVEQLCVRKAFVYPVAKVYYLRLTRSEKDVFCAVKQRKNVQIVFELPICLAAVSIYVCLYGLCVLRTVPDSLC